MPLVRGYGGRIGPCSISFPMTIQALSVLYNIHFAEWAQGKDRILPRFACKFVDTAILG